MELARWKSGGGLYGTVGGLLVVGDAWQMAEVGWWLDGDWMVEETWIDGHSRWQCLGSRCWMVDCGCGLGAGCWVDDGGCEVRMVEGWVDQQACILASGVRSTRWAEWDCPFGGLESGMKRGLVWWRSPYTHTLALTLECGPCPLHSSFQLEGVLALMYLVTLNSTPSNSGTSNLRLCASSDQDQVLGGCGFGKGGDGAGCYLGAGPGCASVDEGPGEGAPVGGERAGGRRGPSQGGRTGERPSRQCRPRASTRWRWVWARRGARPLPTLVRPTPHGSRCLGEQEGARSVFESALPGEGEVWEPQPALGCRTPGFGLEQRLCGLARHTWPPLQVWVAEPSLRGCPTGRGPWCQAAGRQPSGVCPPPPWLHRLSPSAALSPPASPSPLTSFCRLSESRPLVLSSLRPLCGPRGSFCVSLWFFSHLDLWVHFPGIGPGCPGLQLSFWDPGVESQEGVTRSLGAGGGLSRALGLGGGSGGYVGWPLPWRPRAARGPPPTPQNPWVPAGPELTQAGFWSKELISWNSCPPPLAGCAQHPSPTTSRASGALQPAGQRPPSVQRAPSTPAPCRRPPAASQPVPKLAACPPDLAQPGAGGTS